MTLSLETVDFLKWKVWKVGAADISLLLLTLAGRVFVYISHIFSLINAVGLCSVPIDMVGPLEHPEWFI